MPAPSSSAATHSTPSPGTQAPQVKLQPLSAAQVAQYAASTGAFSAPAAIYSSRVQGKPAAAVTPALQCLNFASIAESSVGGGGVPRPYGTFNAARAGDGNATWKRMPPSPGSWQAKALPIGVHIPDEPPRPSQSGHGGARIGPSTSPQRSASAGEDGGPSPRFLPEPRRSTGGNAASGTSTRRSRSFPHLRGPVPATYPGPLSWRPKHGSSILLTGSPARGPAGAGFTAYGSPSHVGPPAAGTGGPAGPPIGLGTAGTLGTTQATTPGMALQEQGFYRRPGSSMHRSLVPLPPPEPNNPAAWFALPAATFLTDLPNVPDHLRLDNGYSVSRDFLLSGLNKKKPLASPPASPHARGQHRSPQHHAAQQQQQQQHFNPHHQELRVEDKQQLWEALEKGSQAQGAPGSGPQAVIGPMGLRGVYVPLDNRAVVLQQQMSRQQLSDGTSNSQGALSYNTSTGAVGGAAGAGGGGGSLDPQQWAGQVLGEEEEEEASLLVSGGVRGGVNLPPEMMLPRRNVPSGW
ncbi:hypothetical protein HYH02_005017 [Chlamydomonas schloesseri]|uniref:Uncharacterized protein n=1 Tax=Chlamydomonas schloesseri TaxID=2026947 RepID=A0A836B835_9CHLO|nr:hypothetical protein HYH02_005017 [Chlamydomonas schloesseri]|eukprot:KAG2450516.1 hypothetical protein HYH02_005017 [Chlamydomonas schloesseri]